MTSRARRANHAEGTARFAATLIALALALVGCGDDDVPAGVDAGIDAGIDSSMDAGTDAGAPAVDSGRDAGRPRTDSGPAPAIDVVPWPVIPAMAGADLDLGSAARVVVSDDSLLPLATILAAELEAITGLPITGARDTSAPGDVELLLDPAFGYPESYDLTVADRVTIRSATYEGLAHGRATLLQLVRTDATRTYVPGVRIEDWPTYPYRGLMVDLGIQYHPIASLYPLIELASYFKIRNVHLHLSDNLVFAFGSEAFPTVPTTGMSYSLAELRALDRFARERGVTLIPEIDLPGHALALISALPETFQVLPCLDATIDFASDTTFAAVQTLIEEVIDTFPSSPYFHIGADEVQVTCADGRTVSDDPDFRAAYARIGASDPQEVFREFLTRVNTVVRARGKQLIAWEGFLPGGTVRVPTDVIIMVFESSYYAPDALWRDGYTLINTSWQPLYVVNGRQWDPEYIYGWRPRRWEHWQDFRPAYVGIELPSDERLLGAQLCAWEQSPDIELATTRRRLAAVAERTWNTDAGLTVADFVARLAVTDARLDALIPLAHP